MLYTHSFEMVGAILDPEASIIYLDMTKKGYCGN